MTGWEAFYAAHGLEPIINVSGTMTSLGASIVVPEARRAVAEILPRFVPIHVLQRKASTVIARLTGGEAGFVTASASAGVTLSVAAAMTGLDPARVERLPDTTGMRDEVLIQAGHMCHYGAPVEQAIRLAGASVVPVGQSTQAMDHQLVGAIGERTAAAVFVVSHHVVDYGQIPLRPFVRICRRHGVPVIVDAASEYDLTGFLAAGADLVVYSSHKFLGGPTAGIVCGRRDLVRAAYMQNIGIGRGMKVGKEGIFGAMTALEAWEQRDHGAIRAQEQAALDLWLTAVAGVGGVAARIVPDPTGNPLDRLRIDVDAARLGASAMAVAAALAAGSPAIIVRDHEVEQGWIQLDPCNLHPGQAQVVAERLRGTLEAAARAGLPEPDPDAWRTSGVDAYLDWCADA
ncbi:MAG: aminotransferase class V-fold PLP-dependent enzyme [Alphaproteobacteria bacterium]